MKSKSNRVLLSLYLAIAYVFVGHNLSQLCVYTSQSDYVFLKTVTEILFFPNFFLCMMASYGSGKELTTGVLIYLILLGLIMWGVFYLIILIVSKLRNNRTEN